LVFGPSNAELARENDAQLVHLTIDSGAVGEDLGVNVIVPPRPGRRGERGLLVFLHGRSGDEESFNETVLRGLPLMHGRGPVVAFPAGGDHGYWHDRAEGDWGVYVMDEVIPLLVRRFGIDPNRLAIGGISMGGFGAFDIALHHPGRFCAVGGHSPALWFEGGETAPGAFDDAVDFERNDVVGTVQADPDAFGDAEVWIDYGTEDPFRVYDEGFVVAMQAGGADLTVHSWPGAHESSYWDEHWPDYQRFYVDALERCG
jgi:S-formylglutathione hydrolase FrmB